jgi:hypothetical protein
MLRLQNLMNGSIDLYLDREVYSPNNLDSQISQCVHYPFDFFI